MRGLTFACLALSLGSPALAGRPYFGVDAGSVRVKANDVDETVAYTTTPDVASGPAPFKYDDVFSLQYDRGLDFGIFGGFDFGWFRLEGELNQKRVGLKRNDNDDITAQFLEELNSALNRPSQAPDPGAPGLPALTSADFQPSSSLKVRSAIANAVIDLAVTDHLSVYGGAGAGQAFASGFDDHDRVFVFQRIFGARYALNDRLEIALKRRNFRTRVIKLDHDPIEHQGNPFEVTQGGTAVTTNAAVAPNIEGQYRARSILVSLIYNLR